MTGERQAARIRALYLTAMLRQDIAYFDMEMTAGKATSRISADTAFIQNAIGEKVRNYFFHLFCSLVYCFCSYTTVDLGRFDIYCTIQWVIVRVIRLGRTNCTGIC